MRERVLVSWSGGKDSTMMLYELRRDPMIEVVALLTTVTEGYDRISMHGVRRTLLARQAAALGLPLEEVWIPPHATNAIYEARMGEALSAARAQGIRRVAFGDLFLEEIKRYREERLLTPHQLEGLFPIWRRETREMAGAFIHLGFRAILVCVDPRVLDASFAGRLMDDTLLRDLPPHVDPCGENGEFHSFVFDGPLFRTPVPFAVGERVERDGFVFCDLIAEE